MPVTEDEARQLKQTGIIFLVGNALLAPVYFANSKVGTWLGVVATLGLGYFLHEEGKKERAKPSLGIFSSPSSGAEDVFNNVLAGGKKICDAYTPASMK